MTVATATVATAPKSAAAFRFISADTMTGIVAYATPSAHDTGRTNIASLDTQTGATYCDCKAGECHKACWHRAAVIAAWDAEPARFEVVWLTDAQLVRYGKKATAMLAVYRARTGRVLPMDAVNLLAARCEYRDRLALADAPLAA